MHTFLSSNYSSTMCYFPRFWGCIFCPTIHSVRSPLGSTHRSHTGSGTEMKGWEDETSTVSMEICKRFNYGLNGKYSNIQDIQTSLGDGPWDAMGCHGMPAMGCHGMPWDAIVVDSQWFSCHVDPLKQSPSGDRTCCYGGFHVCPIRPMVLCSVEMTDPNLGPMLTGCSLWLLLLHLNKLVRFNDSIWCS